MVRRKKTAKPRKPALKKRLSSEEKLRRLTTETGQFLRLDRELRCAVHEFNERDLPAFRAWVAEHLGKEQAELDDLNRQVQHHVELLDRAEFARDMGHAASMRQAMEFARQEMERQTEVEAVGEGDEDADDTKDAPHSPPDIPEVIVDALFESFMESARGINTFDLDNAAYDKARAEFTASFAHAFAGDRVNFEKALLRAGADHSAANTKAVKAVYRRLAKLLHPDHQGKQTEFEKELWQTACHQHQALDLHGIEETEVTLYLDRNQEVPVGLVDALHRLREALGDRVLEAEADLDDARNHPAWAFSAKGATEALLKRMRTAIREELYIVRQRLAYMKNIVAQWLKPRGKRKTASPKKTERKLRDSKRNAGQQRAPSNRPPGDPQVEFPF